MVARLLLVDDHAVVREGLRELLSREADLEVVGEARDVVGALAKLDELSPDLVVVDLSLGTESGLTLIRQVRERSAAKVLVFSMQDETLFAPRALQMGAQGYVGKHEDGEVILEGIRRVLAGKTFVSEVVNQLLLSSLSREAVPGERHRLGLATLSARELEVLRLLGAVMRPAEIAESLGISVKTVETHRMRIKEKLGVETSNELLVLAADWLRSGFLEPEVSK